MLTIQPIPAFNDNYIWAIISDHNCVVVDPGDAAVVLTALEAHKLTLNAILITHHHKDHTGGVNELVTCFDVPVYGPENSPFNGITHTVSEGDLVKVFGIDFTVLEVPGHTLDHIAFYSELNDQAPALFCGDTLFLAGCGRLFEGSPSQMLNAMDRFSELPPKTRVYCAHEYSLSNLAFAKAVEPDNTAIQEKIEACQILRSSNQPTLPSTIEDELLINPFMRSRNPSVIKQIAQKEALNTDDATAVFAAIREWKNQF
jgi:hydroxyacylglutathione hydrolase